MDTPLPHRGRGAQVQPANRYIATQMVQDLEHVEGDEEYLAALGRPPTEYFSDESQTIISQNDSPDISFRYSLNPYRGCLHGCSYCYARPTHEYLGLSAGLDFETKVFVKHRAPELFREWLARPKWQPEEIVFSGVTDCYQPAEREFRLTRGCLEVAAECRQPIGIITKNALVTRDLDHLSQLAAHSAVRVAVSITTLDEDLARHMEPRTSTPTARLRAISQLAAAGVPAVVMVAPVIPGLNDHEIPAILSAAREAGATAAGHVLLRLPLAVKDVFLNWLMHSYPDRASKVESFIRSTRGGKVNESKFGARMRGTGAMAEQIDQTFRLFFRKLGFEKMASLNAAAFRPPRPTTGQLELF
ncbi:MAG: PA0069 family radical SAM protein [Pirellulales bacterium]